MDGWNTGRVVPRRLAGDITGIWREKRRRSRGEPHTFDVRWLTLLLTRRWLVDVLCCDAAGLRDACDSVIRTKAGQRLSLMAGGFKGLVCWCELRARVFRLEQRGYLLGCWLAALLLVNSQLFEKKCFKEILIFQSWA